MKKKYKKQISLGYDPAGKRIRKRIYGNSQIELKAEAKKAYMAFNGANPSNITFREYYEKWNNTYCSKLSFHTSEGYRNAFNKASALHCRKLKSITRTDLQGIINDCWDKPYTCKKIKVFFGALFRSAEIDGITEKNPAVSLKIPPTPREKKKVRGAFTEEEIKAIKSAPFTPQEKLLVDIIYQFGLRPGEAFALKKEDFDFKRGMLTISKALGHIKEQPHIKPTKTSLSRELPLPDEFKEIISPLNDGYLFLNKEGKLLTKNQADTISERICEKINARLEKKTDITLYSFRHNKASVLYYETKISNKAKAKYLGHSEEIFVRTYSHLMPELEDFSVLKKMI